jgi:hypothetical protein
MHQDARICTRLTPRQEQAAISLSSGATIEVAARACGAALRTVKAWLATLPALKQRVNELRTAMTSQALGQLIDRMTSTVDQLSVLSQNAASETVRLMASAKIIELSVKLRATGSSGVGATTQCGRGKGRLAIYDGRCTGKLKRLYPTIELQ